MQKYHPLGDYKVTRIGTVELGVDGSDEYWLVKNNVDGINPRDVERAFLAAVYKDTNAPGGYFCHQVTITPQPLHNNQCIAIVHHRNNV